MSKKINLLLTIIVLIGLQACSGNKYMSQPASADFRVDGENSEWSGRFEVPKKENFAIGISHDKNYLYIAINSMDRTFERQLAMRGLTVWIDAKGKKHETLGLKFQSKMPMDRRSMRDRMNQSSDPNSRDEMFRKASPFKGDLDLIVLDAKNRESLGPNDLIATAIAGDGGLFMEYQVPFSLLGSDYSPGDPIGIGLSSKFDRSNMPTGGRGGMSGGGGGMSGGGMSGGGGKRGGGMSGGGQGMRPDQDDLEVWVKVELSQP